jgi:MFS family permease
MSCETLTAHASVHLDEAAGSDPRRLITGSPMTTRQMLAVAVCTLLSALDGFDILSISYASPAIAREWGIGRGVLGIVLSMELVGMAVGAVTLGQFADRIGRRANALWSLAIMGVGMLACSRVASVSELMLARLLTGLGIGGMVATASTLVSEYASSKARATCMGLFSAGYCAGAIFGGLLATAILGDGSWRNVFLVGVGMSVIAFPLVAMLPEPVGALLLKRRADTLGRINRSLRALGYPQITQLPPQEPERAGSNFGALFSRTMAPVTILLTLTYLLHLMTGYFVVKWVPKIVADLGYSAADAAGVLVWVSVGGLVGTLLQSLLSVWLPLRPLVIVSLLISAAMVVYFGQPHASLAVISWITGMCYLCSSFGMSAIYGLVSGSFPTRFRGSGIGFVMGVGRGGAALSPALAGYLFQLGLGQAGVATLMAGSSALAAGLVMALARLRPAAADVGEPG